MLIKVDDRELDTILAALRHYQSFLERNDDLVPADVVDIATRCGMNTPLGAAEIDDLCERINGEDYGAAVRLELQRTAISIATARGLTE